MNRVILSWLAIRMRSFEGRSAEGRVRVHVSLSRTLCISPHLFPRARSRARTSKAPWGRPRRGRGGEGEIFDRRRDAAVSFISRQEQDPRRSFRPRTGPSRDVIVALHLSPSRFPRCAAGPATFFCSTLKPSNEGEEGGGGKERGERKQGERPIVDRGGEE